VRGKGWPRKGAKNHEKEKLIFKKEIQPRMRTDEHGFGEKPTGHTKEKAQKMMGRLNRETPN